MARFGQNRTVTSGGPAAVQPIRESPSYLKSGGGVRPLRECYDAEWIRVHGARPSHKALALMHANHDLLLFDLDGTLSDPLVGIGRSINYALSHFGYESLEQSSISAYVGPQIDETFMSITGVKEPRKVEDLVSKYRERYAEVGFSENTLYPDIPEVLSKLAETNVPLAVCTSKRKDFAERILEMFDLRGHFRFVSGGDVGIHKWQQIEGLKAMSAVSTSSVMIGDRAVDITAAKRNGLFSAGVLWGHGSRSELEGECPNYLFASPTELHLLLKPTP